MPRLRIVAVNDVYSLENLPRLSSLVRHHRTTDPADAFLVTLAGDFLGPSILSSLDAGRGMVDCLNQIPIDYTILGNHEDEVELDQLRARLHELHGKVLVTNVHGLGDFPTRDVIEVASVKIGLVGVVDCDPTLYRRPPFDGARTEGANDAACRKARALLAEGCAMVIPMTHQRLGDDRALASQRAPHFPLILGGHEHDGHIEEIDGCTIVKAPSEASKAVVIDVTWNAGKTSVNARFDDVASYPEDASLRRRVDAHMARVHELEGATLLILDEGEVLSSIGTRVRQTSMGTLICSRLRDSLGAEACIFNGGGIRGAREYRGQLTYGDVKTEVPFDNEIVVARLPGRVLRDAIIDSRSKAPVESGSFLQHDDGMVVDAENRLVSIGGKPLELDRVHRVALVRNLFEGMDHIEPLVDFARKNPGEIPMPSEGREVKIALVRAFAKVLWQQLGGFDRIDANHDGLVTKEEIVVALAEKTHQPPSSLAAGLVLDALDQNRDRAISREDAES
ncbi:MAG: 5'-nucleotidase C-terminal domain-containing protein [Polyangiales bacterium]